jgi:choice-of-anchor A domain-containing protein
MIAIVGDFTASVVFNVTGGFTCNGCSIVFAATTPGGSAIPPQNVLWNFIGAGDDVSISKPVGSAQGIFLAPGRNLLLDKASLTGALMGAEGGLKLLVHSGAKLTCPQ